MLKITNFKVSNKLDVEQLTVLLSKKLKISTDKLSEVSIIKRSLDARKKPIMYVYTISFKVDDVTASKLIKEHSNISTYVDEDYSINNVSLNKDSKIAIIGYGPAGMFAALNFVNHGFKHVSVFERGEAIKDRNKKISKLFSKGILDVNSNIQFGEGGAGTYSDGKLTSRSKDNRSKFVLETLIKYGAPEDIIYEQHPHVGSDKLQDITSNFSNELLSKNVNINFNSYVSDFKIIDNKITAIQINHDKYLEFDYVVLAIGHSSRDTMETLIKRNISCSQKNFAVGLRIEHPQAMINAEMYQNNENNINLDAASYRLTAKTKVNKSVYSFCMCPGGLVVNSSSEANLLCTNGMSNYRRNLTNANSAILVNVGEEDFGKKLSSGLEYQRKLEKKAFELGGGNYVAPIQNARDFIDNKLSDELVTKPSFPNGFKNANLRELFSEKQIHAIVEALNHFEKIIPGFIDRGVFTGVEARSSSPIRFDRNDLGQSLNISNLYPCGEGAGYAGGIVSSAIDGLRQSQAIMTIVK